MCVVGIWEVLKPCDVIKNVREGIADGKSLDSIAEDLIDSCLAPTDKHPNGMDNMTIVIIALLNGLAWNEWVNEIATLVGQTRASHAKTSGMALH